MASRHRALVATQNWRGDSTALGVTLGPSAGSGTALGWLCSAVLGLGTTSGTALGMEPVSNVSPESSLVTSQADGP